MFVTTSVVTLAKNAAANLAGSLPARVATTSTQNLHTASKKSTERCKGTAVELKRAFAYLIF